mmetsp:Transcript_9700/g.17070  ORF Transcript_9700/g.17070 Transcript_9700/m.17070 type:complete len:361 (-) Transcript_9700:79-1161(-)
MFDTFGANLVAGGAGNGAQRRRSSYHSIGLGGFAESLLSGMGGASIEFDTKIFEEGDEAPYTMGNEAFAAPWDEMQLHNHDVAGAAAVVAPAPRTIENGVGNIGGTMPKFHSNQVRPLPSTPVANYRNSLAQHISPRHTVTGETRKRTNGKVSKVISTITSNRAKPAKTIVCSEAPRKELRQKGTVYQINDERKKWDGRQWRRLCVVEGCCSAARGATDFCIVHGRGEITKAVVDNEEIEVLSSVEDRGRVFPADGQRFMGAASVLSSSKSMLQRSMAAINNVGLHPQHTNNKRPLDTTSGDAPVNKLLKTTSASARASNSGPLQLCQFKSPQGENCGNVFSPKDSNAPYCPSCAQYCRS